jgi:hypothetical protein
VFAPAPAPAAVSVIGPRPLARLATSIAQLIDCLETLSPSAAAPEPAIHQSAPSLRVIAAPTPVALVPTPTLVASVADIKSQLQAIMSVVVLETAAAEAAPLAKTALLPELEAAAASTVPAGVFGPGTETFDPYRWGLIAALNYRPVRRNMGDSGRCDVCGTLLTRTPNGTLRCPMCTE